MQLSISVSAVVDYDGMQCLRLKLEYCNVMRAFIYDPIKNVSTYKFSIGILPTIYIQHEIYYSCHRSTEDGKIHLLNRHIVNTSREKKTCHHRCYCYCLRRRHRHRLNAQHSSQLIFRNAHRAISAASIQCAFVFSMNVIITMELYFWI